MSHQAGASKGEATLSISRISELLRREVCIGSVDSIEYFLDRRSSLGTCTEEKFITWCGVELDDSQTGTFLTTVVLLLHQEIELIEAIHPGAVLLLIVGQGLTQANHRHATFVLEGFHCMKVKEG